MKIMQQNWATFPLLNFKRLLWKKIRQNCPRTVLNGKNVASLGFRRVKLCQILKLERKEKNVGSFSWPSKVGDKSL